jgi:hypothetical protein
MTRIRRIIIMAVSAAVVAAGAVAGVAVSQSGSGGKSSSNQLLYPACKVKNVNQAAASLPANPTPQQIAALCQEFGSTPR